MDSVIKTRAAKRKLEPVDSKDVILIDLAGVREPHVARQKRKSIQVAEEISGSELSSSSWFSNFPRHQRSKREVILIHKKITTADAGISDYKGICRDQIMEGCSSLLNFTPPSRARARARRKRKSKRVTEESSDSEQVSPCTRRCRGLPKRRVNCDNPITQQQGKLDSNTLECYLENLWGSFSEERRNSFAYFDCLWFSLYTKETCKAKVLNWIKKKDIFSKTYVFIPIVQWCHWSLLIFCHFGESQELKTRSPCMLLLDSLQMANPERLEPGIRKFVLDIFKAEERPENKKMISRIPFLVPKVPQQRNGEECGNFVLYYMNLFFENAPENFSILEGYPYFMNEDWFTPEGLECFCKTLDPSCK